jgi:hypothetical protein
MAREDRPLPSPTYPYPGTPGEGSQRVGRARLRTKLDGYQAVSAGFLAC